MQRNIFSFRIYFRRAQPVEVSSNLEYNPWAYRHISPGLVDSFKHILGGLYSRGAVIQGAYIRKAFCVSICVFKTLKSINILIKYLHYRQKRAFFKQKSASFCFKGYLNLSWYLFHIITIDIFTCFIKIYRNLKVGIYLILRGFILGWTHIRRELCVS